MYEITPYTYNQARRLGVDVKPSQDGKHKIDVIKDGKVIAKVGAIGYNDYPTYMKTKGKDKAYADERRRLYKIRHQATRTVKGSRAWWADQLLW